MDEKHVVIGMSGHIDHGKTAIIKALTGTNTDRLKEEQERGITTDLGFAFLGKEITIIDVPGHEKFVKTMVAGVNTVDMAVLVIAADDGVMPQTIEHLEILNLLQIKKGIVALNKVDKVEEDWLDLVEDDINNTLKGTTLEGSQIIRVSALENIGIDNLKNAINNMASKLPPRPDGGLFRLFVDRVFTIKGHGTVVGGTVLSGKIIPDDIVELQPSGKNIRVRRIQVHNKPVEETKVGFRAALNLQGVDKDEVTRGDVLSEPGFCHSTYMLDVKFVLLKSWPKNLKYRTRVRVNLGTSEAIARIAILDKNEYEPGDEGFAQLRFEKPVVAQRGDRFVVRSYSPVSTIGGGVVLDSAPRKHKRFEEAAIDKLKRIDDGDPSQSVQEYLDRMRFIPKSSDEIAKALSIAQDVCENYIESLLQSEDVIRIGKKKFISMANHEMLKKKIITLLEEYFKTNPHKTFLSAAHIRSSIKPNCDVNLCKWVFEELEKENLIKVNSDKVIPSWHSVKLTGSQDMIRKTLLKEFGESGYTPPSQKDIVAKHGKETFSVLEYLIDQGELLAIDDGIIFPTNIIKEALDKIVDVFKSPSDNIGIGGFREIFDGVSRKYVVMILDFSDKIGLTKRVGDGRMLSNPNAGNAYFNRH